MTRTDRDGPIERQKGAAVNVDSFRRAVTRWGWAVIILVAVIASFVEPTPKRMRIMWIVMIVTLAIMVIRLARDAIKNRKKEE